MFEIVPRSDATSFQTGYLGVNGLSAWIIGDVLAKLDVSETEASYFEKW